MTMRHIQKRDSQRNDSIKSIQRSGVTLAWQNLSILVPDKNIHLPNTRPKQRVVKNVSGIVHPGCLLAIMGTSGAGKTTLLETLGFKSPGSLTRSGQIFVNGVEAQDALKELSGYVYQKDLFYERFTVSEHLNFVAKMKMDNRLSQAEQNSRIQTILNDLSLKKCEFTKIKYLSGGERKRLAFASELITKPVLLLCDEPTTGLDSYSAMSVTKIMRDMANNGKTIICTIHQPSSQIFALFDQVCLLTEGRVAYMGPAMSGLEFLRALHYYTPQEHSNPADFYMRIIAMVPGRELESRRHVADICEAYANSQFAKDISHEINTEIRGSQDYSWSQMININSLKDTRSHPSWVAKTVWISHRLLVDSYRNTFLQRSLALQGVILGLFLGLVFSGQLSLTKGPQNTVGIIYLLIAQNSAISLYGALAVFAVEFPIVGREIKAGNYNLSSHYVAKLICTFQDTLIQTLPYVTLLYWIAGLRSTADAFFLSLFIIVLAINSAAAFGALFAATFNNPAAAGEAISALGWAVMVTAGIFLNVQSTPIYLAWVKYISFFYYSYEALFTIQFEGVNNTACLLKLDNLPCYSSGEAVLEFYGYKVTNFWTLDVPGLIGLYIIPHFLTYICIMIRTVFI